MSADAGFLGGARCGVVDIGSNSVRLVIYGGSRRTPIPLVNEKALCGLGTFVPGTTQLRDEAMDQTIAIIKRFATILKEYGDLPVTTFATAAVREAENSAKFVRKIEKLGFSVRILSGEEEAHFAGLGVLSAIPEAIEANSKSKFNICGDLGGGSLELIQFTDDIDAPFAEKLSLKLGPLKLKSQFGADLKAAEKYVLGELSKIKWASKSKGETLFAVGGAWRAIAQIHMSKEGYLLPILNQYTLTDKQMGGICTFIKKQSETSLLGIAGIQRRRASTLPFAAMVLQCLIKATKVKRIIISSYGVREGVLFEELPSKERRQDPLLWMTQKYMRATALDTSYSAEAYRFITPLFSDFSSEEKRLCKAICDFGEVGLLQHPDLRASYSYDFALNAPVSALTHSQRVMMALALHIRYRSRLNGEPQDQVLNLLSEGERERAKKIGLALRFAADLSASRKSLLQHCVLEEETDKLVLSLPKDLSHLMTDVPAKRFKALGVAFARETRVQPI